LTIRAAAICLSVKASPQVAAKIRVLQAFLPQHTPLWITEHGRDKLIFISPELMKRYEEALEPTIGADYSREVLDKLAEYA